MKHAIRGGEVVIAKEMQDLLAEKEGEKRIVLDKCVIKNIGQAVCHVVINGGDELPLEAGEELALADVPVVELKVKEIGAKVKFVGVQQ